VILIELKYRQKQILQIVQMHQPITSNGIAEWLGVSRAAIRADLSVLALSGKLIAKPKVGYFYNDSPPQEDYERSVREILVGDIKSLPVIVDEKTTVYDALVALFLDDASTVFVQSDGILSGLVSRKDFLKAAIGGHDFHKIPIGVIMTRAPHAVVAFPQESILEAAKKIVEHQIDCLPVVETQEKNGIPVYRVVGSISKTNIARLFVELGK